jgi:hypothetical protein
MKRIAQEVPHFIILGAQKCGTTSLYDYLVAHPHVAPACEKEIHFFDKNFRKGASWYQAQFPGLHVEDLVSGEASPYYIFHPHAPRRVLELVPRAKLIVLLRNPIDRAYSHYQHEVRLGFETLSFEDAIAQEEQRLSGEVEIMLQDENYFSFNHQHYSYLARGVYVDQLQTWLNLFPREQILIIKSEDLYNNPRAVWEQLRGFMSLPEFEQEEYANYNEGGYTQMELSIRERLADYFEPYNARLYEYLGINFGWDS